MKKITDVKGNIDEIEEVMIEETNLPQVKSNLLQSNEDFYKLAFQFQEIMMVYESAIKQLETKLEILNKEYKVTGRRNPIETVKSRIKSPDSIAKKRGKLK